LSSISCGIKLDFVKIEYSNFSPIFGRPMDYSTELGDTKRDGNGSIVQAGAIMLRWFAKINQTGKIENDLGTGENVDKINLLWEKELSNFLLGYTMPEGMKLYFNVARRFFLLRYII